MSGAVSVVHAQVSQGSVFQCFDCNALLWWNICERCGGHYECDHCNGVFILKADGWYRLLPNDSLVRVPE